MRKQTVASLLIFFRLGVRTWEAEQREWGGLHPGPQVMSCVHCAVLCWSVASLRLWSFAERQRRWPVPKAESYCWWHKKQLTWLHLISLLSFSWVPYLQFLPLFGNIRITATQHPRLDEIPLLTFMTQLSSLGHDGGHEQIKATLRFQIKAM